MDEDIKNYILNFNFANLQRFKNMGVIPMLYPLDGSPGYLTLKEALEKQVLVVTEVGPEGTVPELKVVNKAEIPVFLLDGEELAGAKQNRVLNTTILLKEKSETVIPVSCTEQGRWSYVSDKFYNAGTIMSPSLRMSKASAVSSSLKESRAYRSDQSAVWDRIDMMAEEAGVSSSTGAMRDIYESKKEELDSYLKAFKCIPKQKGILVFIDGEVVGLDFVSYRPAFEKLHAKLVKSYAMEALLREKEKESEVDIKKARSFLRDAQKAKEKKYKSVGKGWDYRYEGKDTVGSVLKVEDKVIHMAFFRITESDKAGRMAGYRRRRGFRV